VRRRCWPLRKREKPNHSVPPKVYGDIVRTEDAMSSRRKLVPFLFPLLFGLWAVFDIAAKPRFATFHGSDVVQLIAAGMCFGVVLAALVGFFRGRRAAPQRER
jgi:hypothetical protein